MKKVTRAEAQAIFKAAGDNAMAVLTLNMFALLDWFNANPDEDEIWVKFHDTNMRCSRLEKDEDFFYLMKPDGFPTVWMEEFDTTWTPV